MQKEARNISRIIFIWTKYERLAPNYYNMKSNFNGSHSLCKEKYEKLIKKRIKNKIKTIKNHIHIKRYLEKSLN